MSTRPDTKHQKLHRTAPVSIRCRADTRCRLLRCTNNSQRPLGFNPLSCGHSLPTSTTAAWSLHRSMCFNPLSCGHSLSTSVEGETVVFSFQSAVARTFVADSAAGVCRSSGYGFQSAVARTFVADSVRGSASVRMKFQSAVARTFVADEKGTEPSARLVSIRCRADIRCRLSRSLSSWESAYLFQSAVARTFVADIAIASPSKGVKFQSAVARTFVADLPSASLSFKYKISVLF